MGLSLQARVAALPPEERKAWLARQTPQVMDEILRGEWWWVARPEQIPPPGDWLVCLACAGRGYGKMVCVSTLIPRAVTCYDAKMLTNDTQIPGQFGFVKMGDLQVGDWVLDENGKPCRVLATYDATPEVAYRLTFSDGTTVDACSEHQWVTWEHRDRKAYLRSEYVQDTTRFPKDWVNWRPLRQSRWDSEPIRAEDGPGPRVRTTQNIVDTLTQGKRGDRNHCIPVCPEVQAPEVKFSVDPWLLGYWLGNGSTNANALTTHAADVDYICARLRDLQILHTVSYDSAKPNTGRIGVRSGFATALRELGVLSNKFVPEEYLWSSPEQRRQLLAGLVDSDGHISLSAGHVEFCSTRRVLADAVMHLARSLGQRPVLYEDRARLNGVDMGPRFRVCWRPTFNPFLSPRKAAGYVPPDSQGLRTQHRMIVSAERIDPAPMRCITVDSPNSMYLITESFIPTHNSRAGSEWVVERALKHPYDKHGTPTEWLVIAETLSDARTICMEGPAGILRVLDRRKVKYRYKMSPRPMVLFPNGSKIYTEGADDPDVGRGYTSSGAWLDEIAKWKYPRKSWYEGIGPSLRADLAGDHPRAFVTTTPKPIDLLQEWIRRDDGSVHVIRGSTFDNAANLSAHVIQELERRYAGTAIGRQELYGEIIEAFDGALFNRLDIENARVDRAPDNLVNIVVGVDPSLTGEDDEMGIVVVGRDSTNHMFVLADRSVMSVGRAAALHAWRVVAEFGADKLVCEVNLGKRWMQQVFHDAYVELMGMGVFERGTRPPIVGIDTKIGKRTRGEPVAMRCEQGRLHMVGTMQKLEDQMATFVGWGTTDSPDRLDALVHGCRFLIQGEKKQARIASPNETLSTTLQQLFRDVDTYSINF